MIKSFSLNAGCITFLFQPVFVQWLTNEWTDLICMSLVIVGSMRGWGRFN